LLPSKTGLLQTLPVLIAVDETRVSVSASVSLSVCLWLCLSVCVCLCLSVTVCVCGTVTVIAAVGYRRSLFKQKPQLTGVLYIGDTIGTMFSIQWHCYDSQWYVPNWDGENILLAYASFSISNSNEYEYANAVILQSCNRQQRFITYLCSNLHC
jgi:hypothetical protein